MIEADRVQSSARVPDQVDLVDVADRLRAFREELVSRLGWPKVRARCVHFVEATR
jgi:hypothetical protein